jgi:hypothetical protein
MAPTARVPATIKNVLVIRKEVPERDSRRIEPVIQPSSSKNMKKRNPGDALESFV